MLEEKVNQIVYLVRCTAGNKWGGTTAYIFYLHTALVRQTIAYSIPTLNCLSESLESRQHNSLTRILRVCLCVPRATCGILVLAEDKESSVHALRTQERCQHFFLLRTQHHKHSLSTALLSKHATRQQVQADVPPMFFFGGLICTSTLEPWRSQVFIGRFLGYYKRQMKVR